MAAHRVWIMDGHNMIFAIPALQRMQISGSRQEARAGLADRLERFAVARGERVLVVFDGNQGVASAETVRRPLFEVVYARRGEGQADVRIIREATTGFEQGIAVTVVTNDVVTLASKLPRGVRHLGVGEFWRKHIEKRRRGGAGEEGGKPVEGDFSDLEREMLRQAALAEPAPDCRPGPGPARTGRGAPSTSGTGSAGGAAGEGAMPDRVRLKREKGRLRQVRRLSRYAARRR